MSSSLVIPESFNEELNSHPNSCGTFFGDDFHQISDGAPFRGQPKFGNTIGDSENIHSFLKNHNFHHRLTPRSCGTDTLSSHTASPDFSVNFSTMSEINDNGNVKEETPLRMEQSSNTDGSPKAKLEEVSVTGEPGQESENTLGGAERAPSGSGLGYSPLPAPPFSSPDADYGRSPLTIQNLVQNDTVGQLLPSNATVGSRTRLARHQSLEQSPRTRPRSYTADPLGRGSEHVSWQPQARGSNLRNVVGFEDFQNFDQNSSFGPTQLGVAPHPHTMNQQYARGHILGSSHNNSNNTGLPHSSRRTNLANLGNLQSYNFQPSSHDYGNHWQNQSFSSTANPTHSFNDLDNSMRSLAAPQSSSQYGGAFQGYGNNYLTVTRTTARALPSQDNFNPFNLHYKTIKEAQEARRPRDTVIPEDSTIPLTDRERQRSVRKLVEAMCNMDKARDNPNMITTWGKMKDDTKRVEQAAWHVLDLALQVHQDGYPIPSNKSNNNHKYRTFENRWYKMCHGLRYEKTMCKHLCGTNFAEQFVNDPESASMRVQNNRKVNQKKSNVITCGRALLGNALNDRKRSSSSLTREDVSDIGDYNDEEDWNKGDPMYKIEEKTHPQMLTGATPLQSTSIVHKPRSRRHSARENESGSDFEAPPRRKLRESRSRYQLRDGVMVNILNEDRYNDSDHQRNMIIANSRGPVTRRKVYEMQNQILRRQNFDSSKQQQAATHNESGSDMVNTDDEDAEGEADLEYSGYGGDQSALSIASTGRHGQL